MRDNWTETTIGDIAEVIGGGTPSTSKPEYWNGDIIWLTPTEVTAVDGKMISGSVRTITQEGLRNSGARLLPIGTVILTSRASVGFVALAGVELTTNQGFQSLITNKLTIPKFLMMWIQANREEFDSRSAGSTFKEISKTNVKSIAIHLPPIAEQRRIVDVVSSVDAYIDALQQQVDAARTARNAVLHELLTAGGDDWTETTLGDVAEVNMGQSPPGHTYNTEGIGMPFMQGSAEFGEHFPEPVKFCSAPAKIAEVGDLLLSVRAPVGDTNFANQRIAIGRGLATVRASAVSLTEFLRLVIQLNTAGLLATSGTGMFSSITGKNLKEFMILVPPIAEQKRIVEIVSSMDDVIQAAERAVVEAKNLRSGLLSDLLSGEHEIPVSYDELLGAA